MERRRVLVCDSDRADAERLAAELDALGYETRAVFRYAEAFAYSCAFDLDALIVTAQLRGGSAILLPSALGIRRPRRVVLVSGMSERLPGVIITRAGFDAQLVKVVSAEAIDRLLEGNASAQRARRPRSVAPTRPRARAHVSLVARTSDRS